MIFAINALACAFAAVNWSRSSALNLICGLTFAALAVVNAALASPFVISLVRP